jgi:hypothetical protein
VTAPVTIDPLFDPSVVEDPRADFALRHHRSLMVRRLVELPLTLEPR